MNNKRFLSSIIKIMLGTVLVVFSHLNKMDEFWSGMGTALIFVGALFLIRQIRYKADDTYREKVDTETKDERNRFLSMKSWSWTGYLLVLILAIATIVFKIAGQELLMMYSSGVVCVTLIIYWISYLILKRKY